MVQTDDRVEPADSAAAGFYITNPNNSFRDNAASGGWSGFSFPVRYACAPRALCLGCMTWC